MNILMLLSTDIPICDGIASHVVGLAKRLRARGHNITLMTRGSYRGSLEFEYDGFKVIKAPFCPIYPLHVYFHGIFVRKTIEGMNPQPDLIHLHTPLVPPLPKKWPIVITFHSPMLVGTAYVGNLGIKTSLIKLMGKTISYWIEKKLLDISDAVITVSHGVAEELKSYYGYDGRYLNTILNIVDSNFYRPATSNNSNTKSHKRKVLYVGRLSFGKGLTELIDSASIVLNKYKDIEYILVGSGQLEEKLKDKVNKLGLTEYFKFIGKVNDPLIILHYYQEAYLFLFPSYYEGCPMSLLEAMSCGLPVVTSRANFSEGVIRNEINGLLVQPKSVDELAKATIKLLSSEELCKSLGKAARETIELKMDSEKNTNDVEMVYKEAVKKFKMKKT